MTDATPMQAGSEQHSEALVGIGQHVGAHAAGLDCLPDGERNAATEAAGDLLRDAADRIIVAARELRHHHTGMSMGELPISQADAQAYRNCLQLIVTSTEQYASADPEPELDVPEREAFVRGLQSAADVARKALQR